MLSPFHFRPLDSLHGYFLRPGSTATPIIYTLTSPRDGS